MSNEISRTPHIVVIGSGFCGLAAAWELISHGVRVTVLERDADIGGLAGSFVAGGARLEKFYHHWFTSDTYVMQVIHELGMSDRIIERPTRTGMYYAHNFFKLSTPFDLLRFSPLPFWSRVRLGFLALRVRRVRDWHRLENITAANWLRKLGGENVYRAVWEPLLRGKFGDLAEQISAVWFWNKIKLRGSSRGRTGEERLAYFQGGFAALADALADAIRARGGEIKTATHVTGLTVNSGRVTEVKTERGSVFADAVIATPALPIIADLVEAHTEPEYVARLQRIRYLANVCVVYELSTSLSDIYWLNVNDPSFPFVGVIEHTNFEPTSSYSGMHIVYLSKYLPETDPFYRMADEAAVAFSLGHLRRMFPELSDNMVLSAHVWRARYAQPVVECGYRQMIPDTQTPLANLFIATMAQIYPQDRGTNYALQLGRKTARLCVEALTGTLSEAGADLFL